MRFVKESVIRCPPERVWAFHELPDAFQRLVPPWGKVRVVKQANISEIGSKTIIEGKVLGPFRVRWIAEHPDEAADIIVSGGWDALRVESATGSPARRRRPPARGPRPS